MTEKETSVCVGWYGNATHKTLQDETQSETANNELFIFTKDEHNMSNSQLSVSFSKQISSAFTNGKGRGMQIN